MNWMISLNQWVISINIKRNKPWGYRPNQGSASISNDCFVLSVMSFFLIDIESWGWGTKTMHPVYHSSNGLSSFGSFSASASASFAFKFSPKSTVLSFKSCRTTFSSSSCTIFSSSCYIRNKWEVQYLLCVVTKDHEVFFIQIGGNKIQHNDKGIITQDYDYS